MTPTAPADAATTEDQRLDDAQHRRRHWKRWGPYVSERAWGTVREDYSADGAAWEYLPHDHARSRAYRWNEDGIAGISDRHQILCFALALWNGRDPILKERLFGLTGKEGNHGEDVKEVYHYLDSTPTHSYMKFLYKYPQRAFPYAQLVAENARRGRDEPAFGILQTSAFDEDRYFDVLVEYGKADCEDIAVRITAINRGPEPALLHLLPTLWFRNTWSWGRDDARRRAGMRAEAGGIVTHHPDEGSFHLSFEPAGDSPDSPDSPGSPGSNDSPALLFCDNETNTRRLFGAGGPAYPKDGIGDHVVLGAPTVNPARTGSKAAVHHRLAIPAGGARTVRLRLARRRAPAAEVDAIIEARRAEADAYFQRLAPAHLSEDARAVMRQALAGMLWSKQYYHFIVRDWLHGDPGQPPPPAARRAGRNADWGHLYCADVLSMPDKWEYPWFAAWDLAFHCIPLAMVDVEFAKEQLLLLLREWYMHPNGQIPAYEWAFGDVNPPVFAWAAWRVYKMEKKRRGHADRRFLKRVFHKLMLNFTWWVNRKDEAGRNVFQGGFLGLDNIGVFDRSAPLPGGGHLEQSDGTSWMAMFCLNMLTIALELALEDESYEDVASKFWEHFVHIARAMNTLGLWDEADGFYYDTLHRPDGRTLPLRVRSMVGLIPLFAVEAIEADRVERFGGFARRLEWFIDHRPDLTAGVADMRARGASGRRLFAVVGPERLARVLEVMLDEAEFLAPHGVRALSRAHRDRPFELRVGADVHRVRYEPGESASGLFGGNSNWRGPIWFPVNYLLIESLQKFHHYLGDGFRVEFPTGSGVRMTLAEVARELSRRLSSIFLRDGAGRRPVFGGAERFQRDPHFRDHLLFYEYFHGDDGAGLGASHQTGWTGLVAKLLAQSGE